MILAFYLGRWVSCGLFVLCASSSYRALGLMTLLIVSLHLVRRLWIVLVAGVLKTFGVRCVVVSSLKCLSR